MYGFNAGSCVVVVRDKTSFYGFFFIDLTTSLPKQSLAGKGSNFSQDTRLCAINTIAFHCLGSFISAQTYIGVVDSPHTMVMGLHWPADWTQSFGGDGSGISAILFLLRPSVGGGGVVV